MLNKTNEEIVKRARELINEYDLGILMITLSDKGMLAVDPEMTLLVLKVAMYICKRAGDTVISVLAAELPRI